MLGPMSNELKQRKPMVTRKRAVRPTDTSRPDELKLMKLVLKRKLILIGIWQ
ncbi:hypothetical protein E1A91_D11G240900v1 [Gossypium mustelinum]|uniref:Uncharacterized protein n=1 Tax=Gossypium mustelinum TaxID=34275 RepID=A0A5D2SWS0_GOSMU|nr:hypothetical protein E1A91_D11G240900v1 [Gossypium mustelinum]